MTNATTPISLVPCPFCGSTFAGKVEVKGGFRLRCIACDAQSGVGMTDEVLKGYWERRPFTHSEIGEIERMRKALQQIYRHTIVTTGIQYEKAHREIHEMARPWRADE